MICMYGTWHGTDYSVRARADVAPAPTVFSPDYIRHTSHVSHRTLPRSEYFPHTSPRLVSPGTWSNHVKSAPSTIFWHSTIFLQFFPQHHDPQMFVKETQTLPVLCWVQPWSSVPSVLLSLSLSRLSLSSDEAMSRVSIVTWSPLKCQHCHCLPTGLT